MIKMDKFSLKWNDFQSNVAKTFSVLRKEEDFFDVTLVTDERTAHFSTQTGPGGFE